MERERTNHTPRDIIWCGRDYQNRTVTLYVPERDHIANGHKVMATCFTAIYDSVEHPESVFLSEEDAMREVFFKKSKKASFGERFYTKTIVEYNDSNTEGFIVTAFPCEEEGGNIGMRTYPTEFIRPSE